MKTIAAIAAIAGTLSLGACGRSPEAAAIDQNAAMIQDSLERQADNLEAMANNAADEDAGEAMRNVADRLDEAKDNVAAAADAAKDKLRP